MGTCINQLGICTEEMAHKSEAFKSELTRVSRQHVPVSNAAFMTSFVPVLVLREDLNLMFDSTASLHFMQTIIYKEM